MKYAIVLAATAFAWTAAMAGEKAMDTDWDAKVEEHFKEVDADKNGSVTEQELVDYATAKAKKEFAEASGGDGAVSLEEAKAHHKAKHEAMMKEHGEKDHGEHKAGDH